MQALDSFQTATTDTRVPGEHLTEKSEKVNVHNLGIAITFEQTANLYINQKHIFRI